MNKEPFNSRAFFGHNRVDWSLFRVIRKQKALG